MTIRRIYSQLRYALRRAFEKIKVSIYGDSYLFKRISSDNRLYGTYFFEYYNDGFFPTDEFLRSEFGISLFEWLDENRDIDMLKKYWIREEEYKREWEKTQALVFRKFNRAERFYSPEKSFPSSWLVRGYSGDFSFLDKEEFERLRRCLIALGEDTIIIVEDGGLGPFSIRLRLPVTLTWEDIWKEGYLLGTLLSNSDSNFCVFGSKLVWGKYVALCSNWMINLIGFSKDNDSLLSSYMQDIDPDEVLFDGQNYRLSRSNPH